VDKLVCLLWFFEHRSDLLIGWTEDKEYSEDSSSDPASPTFLEATNRAHFAEEIHSIDF